MLFDGPSNTCISITFRCWHRLPYLWSTCVMFYPRYQSYSMSWSFHQWETFWGVSSTWNLYYWPSFHSLSLRGNCGRNVKENQMMEQKYNHNHGRFLKYLRVCKCFQVHLWCSKIIILLSNQRRFFLNGNCKRKRGNFGIWYFIAVVHSEMHAWRVVEGLFFQTLYHFSKILNRYSYELYHYHCYCFNVSIPHMGFDLHWSGVTRLLERCPLTSDNTLVEGL